MIGPHDGTRTRRDVYMTALLTELIILLGVLRGANSVNLEVRTIVHRRATFQELRSEHCGSHLELQPWTTLFLSRARLLIESASSASRRIRDPLRRSLSPECSFAPTGSTSLPLTLSWILFSLLYGLRSPADGNSRIFAHLVARIQPVQYIS